MKYTVYNTLNYLFLLNVLEKLRLRQMSKCNSCDRGVQTWLHNEITLRFLFFNTNAWLPLPHII